MPPTQRRLVLLLSALALACEPRASSSAAASPGATTPPPVSAPPAAPPVASALAAAPPVASAPPAAPLVLARAECKPADWTPRSLPALLEKGKGAPSARADQAPSPRVRLDSCTDAPDGAPLEPTQPLVVDGVEIRVRSVAPAGTSGRNWRGNRCTFELRLADGSGAPVVLGKEHVPPFNTITTLVRSGSAAWLSIGFNGYTKEFPGGGNRVVAVDLCAGRVSWQSKDATSNGGLLLVDDYLIAPFGFTSERRFVHVLDARSGNLLQRLPVIENVCPSKSWAPNWHPGERCDAPGQAVGAASEPRIEDGLFYVDTNTGSAAFHFKPQK